MTDRRWGHIKLSRKFFEEDKWWNEKRARTKAEAWLDCIYMAAWKPRKRSVGWEVEHLARGEFLASIRFLAERWRWSKWQVEKFLEVTQKHGQLIRQRYGQGGAIYLLANYESYQGNEPEERTAVRTEDRTPPGHLPDKIEAVKQVRTTWLTPYADLWSDRCGNPPIGKLSRVLGQLRSDHGEATTLAHWQTYLAATEPRFCSPHRFAETFNIWAPPDTKEMTDDCGVMRLHKRHPDSGAWVVA